MAGVMASAMKKAAGGKGNNKAQMLAMQAMLEKMFDGAVPTSRKILGDETWCLSERPRLFERHLR